MHLSPALTILALGVSSSLARFCGDNFYGSLYNITEGTEYWSSINLISYPNIVSSQDCADKCTQWNTNNSPECIIASWQISKQLCYLKNSYTKIQANVDVDSYASVCCNE